MVESICPGLLGKWLLGISFLVPGVVVEFVGDGKTNRELVVGGYCLVEVWPLNVFGFFEQAKNISPCKCKR